MAYRFFTSEAVSIGHPDKLADQIADVILDECLRQDLNSKVACEVMVSKDVVIIAGEISSNASLNYEDITKRVIKKAGYTKSSGFDADNIRVMSFLKPQSPDIAQGISKTDQGAGDLGVMFGYATSETEEYMPCSLVFAQRIMDALKKSREQEIFPFLFPDGKVQVTIEETHIKNRIHTVVLSQQHNPEISIEELSLYLIPFIKKQLPIDLIDKETSFYVNPTGRFVIGGPSADTGLTGRKQLVDTYGGIDRIGGGSFSGKDPSKMDRSGSYMARFIAKNIVMAKLATKCSIQLVYAIGISHPLIVEVNTFSTGNLPDEKLEEIVRNNFDLTPHGIVKTLNLLRPIYEKTAYGGHFGRYDEDFTWEKAIKIKF